MIDDRELTQLNADARVKGASVNMEVERTVVAKMCEEIRHHRRLADVVAIAEDAEDLSAVELDELLRVAQLEVPDALWARREQVIQVIQELRELRDAAETFDLGQAVLVVEGDPEELARDVLRTREERELTEKEITDASYAAEVLIARQLSESGIPDEEILAALDRPHETALKLDDDNNPVATITFLDEGPDVGEYDDEEDQL